MILHHVSTLKSSFKLEDKNKKMNITEDFKVAQLQAQAFCLSGLLSAGMRTQLRSISCSLLQAPLNSHGRFGRFFFFLLDELPDGTQTCSLEIMIVRAHPPLSDK